MVGHLSKVRMKPMRVWPLWSVMSNAIAWIGTMETRYDCYTLWYHSFGSKITFMDWIQCNLRVKAKNWDQGDRIGYKICQDLLFMVSDFITAKSKNGDWETNI